MPNNRNTHAIPLYALARYGAGAGRRYTPYDRQLEEMDFTRIRIFRPYQDPRDTEIPSPDTFYDLKIMACEECGHRARPRQLEFWIEHRTEMGSRQVSHRVQLQEWNFGRFRDCFTRNPATAPVVEVFWRPSLATLRYLRDAVYDDDDDDASSEWSSYA
ncbi:hypothetical protein B0H65DRAFT_424858 [Neurospora tetraspora]|uniref:Uncharacterized protein n=1 Tax=Neurospora tetraspora TaxID=94610 RepID=A0AAE0MTN2_9PEZI|nr:hypothetical protein B0H65DRAFT_424858 [Neurospora tetraspora]